MIGVPVQRDDPDFAFAFVCRTKMYYQSSILTADGKATFGIDKIRRSTPRRLSTPHVAHAANVRPMSCTGLAQNLASRFVRSTARSLARR